VSIPLIPLANEEVEAYKPNTTKISKLFAKVYTACRWQSPDFKLENLVLKTVYVTALSSLGTFA
jgi:hypothetical protein